MLSHAKKTKAAELIAESLLEGAFVAGEILANSHVYAVIAAPLAGGEHVKTLWNHDTKLVQEATSYSDGLANTVAMAEAGSALAKWALELRVGGQGDWYIPSRDELGLCYRYTCSSNEAFDRAAYWQDVYWSSTQDATCSYNAWAQVFINGLQYSEFKSNTCRVRVVRRIALRAVGRLERLATRHITAMKLARG